MPIFEYLCPACNRVFSFLVRNTATAKKASCPKCGSEDMKKMLSKFAVVGDARHKGKTTKKTGDAATGDMPDLDPRAEREMMKLLSQAESIDENDPRQLGSLMRKMSEIAGEPLDGEMEEAVRRLEAGEDPEKIEESLGDLDDAMGGPGASRGAPTYDDGLYSL